MILLGAFCGLPSQEIAGLHWTDVPQLTMVTDSRHCVPGSSGAMPLPAREASSDCTRRQW